MASQNYSLIFSGLGGLGFMLIWGLMGLNGGASAMMKAAWLGSFPDGTLLQTTHTGIWPLDFPINVLVAFFADVNKLRGVDSGPYLMLLDLTMSMLVVNMMVLVESRRSSNHWLQFPALWQYAWDCGGVAVFLPIWALLYMKQRATGRQSLAFRDAQVFPFTAILSILLLLPLIVPAFVDATRAAGQQGVILWLLGPLLLTSFHNLIGGIIGTKEPQNKASGDISTSQSVKTAYCITATIGAFVHVGCVIYALASHDPAMSLGRLYFPYAIDQSNKQGIITESAFLFLKYDYLIMYATVLILGHHILQRGSDRPGPNSKQGSHTMSSRSALTFFVVTSVFGPGAGIAYAASCDED